MCCWHVPLDGKQHSLGRHENAAFEKGESLLAQSKPRRRKTEVQEYLPVLKKCLFFTDNRTNATRDLHDREATSQAACEVLAWSIWR